MLRKVLSIAFLAGAGVAVLSAADAGAGGAVYAKSCKSCHGADGTPNSMVAKMMGATIPDLKSPEVQALTDDQIKSVISAGKGKMKPMKTVAGADLDNVAAFVHTLKK